MISVNSLSLIVTNRALYINKRHVGRGIAKQKGREISSHSVGGAIYVNNDAL